MEHIPLALAKGDAAPLVPHQDTALHVRDSRVRLMKSVYDQESK